MFKTDGRCLMWAVVDSDSKWTSIVEGMTAYSPEDLKKLLDDAGFTQTQIHRRLETG